MKKIFLFLILAALAISVIGILTKKAQTGQINLNLKQNSANLNKIKVGNNTLNIEIADTQASRLQGLSDREKLDQNSGMLFVFDKTDEIRGFWMKDMNFPLDFIWINDDKIIQIDKNVPAPAPDTPDSQLTIYQSHLPVDYVLEVNAGFADQNNLKVGDSVEIKY